MNKYQGCNHKNRKGLSWDIYQQYGNLLLFELFREIISNIQKIWSKKIVLV